MKHFFVWTILAFSLMIILKTESASAKTVAKKTSQVSTAETAPSKIKIAAADRTCRKDADCESIAVKCSCSCGEGVNKAHTKKYTQMLEQMCLANPPEKVCKVICNGQVKCKDRLCTYISK